MEDLEYTLCTHCGEEYAEDELYVLDLSGTWQDNVCELCIDRYEWKKDDVIGKAIANFDDDWADDNHERYVG